MPLYKGWWSDGQISFIWASNTSDARVSVSQAWRSRHLELPGACVLMEVDQFHALFERNSAGALKLVSVDEHTDNSLRQAQIKVPAKKLSSKKLSTPSDDSDLSALQPKLNASWKRTRKRFLRLTARGMSQSLMKLPAKKHSGKRRDEDFLC